jgi:hypothetical protein
MSRAGRVVKRFWGVRDMKMDANSFHLETPLSPSVSCTHGWRTIMYD